jgi:hypothetical protein
MDFIKVPTLRELDHEKMTILACLNAKELGLPGEIVQKIYRMTEVMEIKTCGDSRYDSILTLLRTPRRGFQQR